MPNPCPECDTHQDQQRRDCQGLNQLRRFDNWADLAAHLDEATIVSIVNMHAAIVDDYIKLKDADHARRQKTHHRNMMNRQLIEFARRFQRKGGATV